MSANQFTYKKISRTSNHQQKHVLEMFARVPMRLSHTMVICTAGLWASESGAAWPLAWGYSASCSEQQAQFQTTVPSSSAYSAKLSRLRGHPLQIIAVEGPDHFIRE